MTACLVSTKKVDLTHNPSSFLWKNAAPTMVSVKDISDYNYGVRMRSTKAQHQDYDSLISISHRRGSIDFLPNSIWVKRDAPCLSKNQVHPGAGGRKAGKQHRDCDNAEGSVSALQVRLRQWRGLFFKSRIPTNQCLTPPVKKAVGLRMLLLLKPGVESGGVTLDLWVQGHSRSWPPFGTQFMPCCIKYLAMETSTAIEQYSEQYSRPHLEANTCQMCPFQNQWQAPQMCSIVSKRTDVTKHVSHSEQH